MNKQNWDRHIDIKREGVVARGEGLGDGKRGERIKKCKLVVTK